MDTVISLLRSEAVLMGSRIIAAVVVLLAGRFLIRIVVKLLSKNPLWDRTEGAVKTFTVSFTYIGLYVLLGISIVGILGVPMASIAAVVASAGVAIGLAMQGALANLAGGIMLLVFKPFKLGDYIEACDFIGTAAEINLFYTVLITPDNKRITIPNGTLMNAAITDYSANPVRRVEAVFTCSRKEDPARVQEIMLAALAKEPKVLSASEAPEAPFARISGNTNEAYEFTVRAWCKSEEYLSVLFDLNQHIIEAMAADDVQAPAMRVVVGQDR